MGFKSRSGSPATSNLGEPLNALSRHLHAVRPAGVRSHDTPVVDAIPSAILFPRAARHHKSVVAPYADLTRRPPFPIHFAIPQERPTPALVGNAGEEAFRGIFKPDHRPVSQQLCAKT